MIISPFTALYRGFLFLFEKFTDVAIYAVGTYDKYVCDPLYEKYIENLNENQIYSLYRSNRLDSSVWGGPSNKEYKDFRSWKEANKNWKKILQDIQDRHEAQKEARLLKAEADREKNAKKEKRKQAFFNAIVKYTKYLVPVVGVGLASAVLYGIYKFFAWITVGGYWVNIGIIVLVILGIVLVLLVLAILAAMFGHIRDKSCNLKAPGIFKKSFYATGRGIHFVTIKPLGAVIEFFVDFFVAYKENNCPPINWED